MMLTAATAETVSSTHEQTLNPASVTASAEQQQRAGAWALLGRLLRSPPEIELLQQLTTLNQNSEQASDGDLALAMSMLSLAAERTSQTDVDDEFHALFIGLGRGELVPYGSWYLTGYLMEKPLSLLRDDLGALGYERDKSVHEPEDHAAALCEVMSMLVMELKDHETQKQFFSAHIATWIKRFFSDLSQAESAVFYRATGRFGLAFISFEEQYLNMNV